MCEPDEICVNGPQPPGEWTPPGYSFDIPKPHYARCVSHEYYVKLLGKAGQPATPSAILSGFEAQPGSQYGFEALLTTENSNQVVTADSLQVQPLRADGTPTAPEQKCNDCSGIDINYVPPGTARMSVNLGLLSIIGVVQLYLIPTRIDGFLGSSNTTTDNSTVAVAQS